MVLGRACRADELSMSMDQLAVLVKTMAPFPHEALN